MSSPHDGTRPDPAPFDQRHPPAGGDSEATARIHRRPAAARNREMTEEERLQHEMFELADTNHDGVLSRTEQLAFRAYLARAKAGKELHEPLPNDPVPHGDDLGPLAWHEFVPGDLPPARQKRWRRVAGRTLGKAWGDSLFGLSAQAAFWCALSTAPILLALLGLVGLIAPLFGPDTIDAIRDQVDRFLHQLFNPEVATNLVGNTVETILDRGRTDVVSVGLVISLWAGSSAMSAFVEAITVAYRQHEFRHPVKERFFALGLYLIALVFGILLLPLIAIGPEYLPRLFPQGWRDNVASIIGYSYYPATVLTLLLLLTTLYKVAPKVKHPWVRGIPGAMLAAAMFLVFSFGLRLYLAYVYSHGLTYGALATPITFLLFYYFASMAIILGAQFNNALLEYFPVRKRTRSMQAAHPGPDAPAPVADHA